MSDEFDREMEEHWQRVLRRRSYATALAPNLDAVADAGTFRVPQVQPSSRVPGGELLHRLIGATVTRHLQDLVPQLDAYARAVHECLVAIVDTLDDPADPETVARLDDVADQLAELRRTLNRLAGEP